MAKMVMKVKIIMKIRTVSCGEDGQKVKMVMESEDG